MDIALRHEGPVAVLTWNDGENRLYADSLAALNARLDELEGTNGSFSLVVTGVGKFFSNGLDLARFGDRPEEFASTIDELQRTVGRLLLFPAYCVAALNGHTFAGAALLSCAFDYRVMRNDRGYWCMNEAEIGLSLSTQLWSILEHRLPKATAVEAATTARRYSGPDALGAGIVEAIASENDVLDHAVEVAHRFAHLDRDALAKHKYLAHGAAAKFLGFET